MALPWQPASPALPWEPAAGCGALPRGALPRGATSLRDHRRGFGALGGSWWGRGFGGFGAHLSPAGFGLGLPCPPSPRDFGFRSFGAQPQLSGRTAGTPVPPSLPSHRDAGSSGGGGVATAQALRCGLGVPRYSPRAGLKDGNNEKMGVVAAEPGSRTPLPAEAEHVAPALKMELWRRRGGNCGDKEAHGCCEHLAEQVSKPRWESTSVSRELRGNGAHPCERRDMRWQRGMWPRWP